MDALSFAQLMVMQLNLHGNFVAIRSKNKYGDMVAMTPVDFGSIDIKRNNDTRRLEYRRFDGAVTTTYSRGDVFHVTGLSTNGIIGLSPIDCASQAIKLGKTYEDFSLNYFKNSAMPSGIFKHQHFLNEDSYKRLKDQIKENYQAMKTKGSPILAEDGLDFVPFVVKLAEAELLSSKKYQIEDICRIFRVPLHLVQNLDKATNNNIEHQSLEFVMYTMLPWYKRVEAAINSQLLSAQHRRDGYYLEYNMSGLLRGDQKSMAEAFAIGRQWGWLSVNDIRRLMNMNSVENGDIYLQPMNMIEAGRVPEPDKKIIAQIEQLIGEAGK
jgi:HK97 family phage portal protein